MLRISQDWAIEINQDALGIGATRVDGVNASTALVKEAGSWYEAAGALTAGPPIASGSQKGELREFLTTTMRNIASSSKC